MPTVANIDLFIGTVIGEGNERCVCAMSGELFSLPHFSTAPLFLSMNQHTGIVKDMRYVLFLLRTYDTPSLTLGIAQLSHETINIQPFHPIHNRRSD